MSGIDITVGAPKGRLELLPIRDLAVLEHIQRIPKESRLKAMSKHGWQPKKQGILLVAEIVDGPHAGTLHVYDGGTRFRLAKMTVGDEYVMPCWVEPMTEAEAAEKFDIFNSESKKPTAFDHYKVGVAYGEPHQVAIKKGLDALGLVGGETSSYGNGEPGVVAALASCKRIVEATYRATKDGEETHRWAEASRRLVEVLSILRDAYTDETAHDSDMMQAVNRIRVQHGAEFSGSTRDFLVKVIGSATASRWRSLAQSNIEQSGSQGGSASRANFIATLLATEHNRAAPPEAQLNTALARA